MSEQTWRWGPAPPDDGITVEELRPHGWAPGKYVCSSCSKCGEQHGDCDKRSRTCRPCAVASLKTAQAIAGHRAHWSFYGIPRMAQTVFRLRAMEARCDEPDAVSAFAAAGVTEFLRTVVETFDAVMAHLAAMPAEARPGIEADVRRGLRAALAAGGPA